MANVLIVAYLLIVLSMIAVILLQRSEGGALGIGGGGGGLVSARGSANLLSRTTAILAALFMATAIGLTVISDLERSTDSILDNAASGGGAATSVLDALNALQSGGDFNLPATTEETPAADAPAEPAASSDGPDLAMPTPEGEPAAQ